MTFEHTTRPDLPDVLASSCAKLGIEPEAISALQSDLVAAVDQALSDEAAAREQSRRAILEELTNAWGADADQALNHASSAALAFGLEDDDVADLLDLGDPARVVTALARLGKALADLDEQSPAVELFGQGGTMTGEAAAQELDRLSMDTDHRNAFLNRAHPGHDAAKAQRAQLLSFVAGGKTHG